MAFSFPTSSSCFLFPNYLRWAQTAIYLPSSLSYTNTGSRLKVLESWGSSRGTDKLFYLKPKSTPLPFFVAVYLLPTMAKGGQLRRRTTLSCLHFSIHAGMSAHSYSMSVSLRLAKQSGSTSIRHHLSFLCGRFLFFFFPLTTYMRDF